MQNAWKVEHRLLWETITVGSNLTRRCRKKQYEAEIWTGLRNLHILLPDLSKGVKQGLCRQSLQGKKADFNRKIKSRKQNTQDEPTFTHDWELSKTVIVITCSCDNSFNWALGMSGLAIWFQSQPDSWQRAYLWRVRSKSPSLKAE